MTKAFIITLTLACVACQKQDPSIEAIMAEFKRTANDPASIEYVETLTIDTLTKKEAREHDIIRESDVLQAQIRAGESTLSLLELYSPGEDRYAELKSELDISIAEIDARKKEIDSLNLTLSNPDSNEVKEIYHYCTIRGKNAMGALVLNTYKATFINGKLERLSQVED